MKYISTTIITCLTYVLVTAQPCGIDYSYDNAGNRIMRSECYNAPNLEEEDTDFLKSLITDQDEKIEENITISDISDLVVFPNPSVGRFRIRSSHTQAEDEVYINNASGQLITHQLFGDGAFDLSEEAAGIYYILIRHRSGAISSSKIICIDN